MISRCFSMMKPRRNIIVVYNDNSPQSQPFSVSASECALWCSVCRCLFSFTLPSLESFSIPDLLGPFHPLKKSRRFVSLVEPWTFISLIIPFFYPVSFETPLIFMNSFLRLMDCEQFPNGIPLLHSSFYADLPKKNKK